MIVCHCAAVTDRDIVKAVRQGAETLTQVCHRTGAGLCCGSCRRDVLTILQAEQAQAAASHSPMHTAPLQDALASA